MECPNCNKPMEFINALHPAVWICFACQDYVATRRIKYELFDEFCDAKERGENLERFYEPEPDAQERDEIARRLLEA